MSFQRTIPTHPRHDPLPWERVRETLLLLCFRRAGFQYRIALQRQLHGLAGFGSFVDAEDDYDRAAPLVAVDGRWAILFHGFDEVAELNRVAVVADRGWVARSAAGAFVAFHL